MLREFLAGIGRFCADHPYLTLALVLALQIILPIDARGLWFSDEVRYAGVLRELLDRGHWLVLHLNGEMYPDKPPIYFWFLAGLSKAFGGPTTFVLFLGSAFSGLFFVWAAVLLARSVAGCGKLAALVSGLVLLSLIYVVGLTQYVRMDLMFAAIIILSQVCLYHGLSAPAPSRLTVAGFGLAAVATLVKGPLGLAFPLLSAFVFFAWRGELTRLKRRDALLGYALALALLAAWAIGSLLAEGSAYLDTVLYKQVYRRAVDAWHHDQPWHHYFWTLPLVWLPWTFLLACLPVGRALSRGHWRALWAVRREADGPAFIWVMLLSGFGLLTVVSTKIVVYLLPIFAPLAILTARGFLSLSPALAGRFFGIVAGLYGLLALVAPFAEIANPWGLRVQGLGLVCLALLALGASLFRLRHSALPALAALVLGTILLIQPLGRLTLPSLDGAMSPRAQALLMKDYVSRGYAPAAFNTYAGIYTYYAGRDVFETQDRAALSRFLAEHPAVVLAMKEKDWLAWTERPEGLNVVERQFLVDRPYVLAVRSAGQAMKNNQPE